MELEDHGDISEGGYGGGGFLGGLVLGPAGCNQKFKKSGAQRESRQWQMLKTCVTSILEGVLSMVALIMIVLVEMRGWGWWLGKRGAKKSLCLCWLSQEENPDRGHSHGAAPLPPFAIGIELN